MAIKTYALTDEHRAQLGPWKDRWIANALSTAPMTAQDHADLRIAIRGLYIAAGLTPPPDRRIIVVPSPTVARFAGGFAAAIWYLRTQAATEDATGAATEAATGAATEDATWAATEDATRAATWDATEAATRAATWDATEAATRDATKAATEAATWAATRAATKDATGAATWDATRAATEDATRAATWAATEAATEDATEDATRAATGAATRDATGAATEDATEAATWDATKAATRDATEDNAWYRIPTRALSCLARVLFRGDAVLALQYAVNAYDLWQGGNQWSGWVAFLSFFRHVAQLPLDYSHWQHYETAARFGPRVMHKEFCLVSERPVVLTVDDQSRPHNDHGPFCRWRDGTALYAVHGVRVPWWIIEHPERLTAARIRQEANAEVRRVMLERFGFDRYVRESGAMPIHADARGTLYRVELPNDEPIVMVRVENSTPEPDGTAKQYTLRVPPTIKTASEAVAWSFGLSAQEYQPVRET